MTKKRWAAKDKSRIVMESLTTATPVVDICKKYGLSPNTFYPWREKFIEAGKTALAGGNNGHTASPAEGERFAQAAPGRVHPCQQCFKKNLGGK